MSSTLDLHNMEVGMLAPRMCELGHDPCGGSEVILWEDARILNDAGLRARVYGSAVRTGAPATALRLRTQRPLITSLEYCGQFLLKQPRAFVLAYNEPTLAFLAPERSIVRFDFTTPLPRYWRLPACLRRFQRGFYLFPSESERHLFLTRHEKIPYASTAVLPNAVDTELFCPADGPPQGPDLVVGYAGQWAPGKGIRELVCAWEIVRSQCTSARLRLAGGDAIWRNTLKLPEEYDATAEINAMARTGSVEVVGPLPRCEMPGFWNSVHIAVVPSLAEAFGLVALEAMSCGVPVVATAVGGLKEIVVDGESGVLVPPREPTALATAILALMRDKELRRCLASGARQRAHRFSLAVRSRRLIEVISDRVSHWPRNTRDRRVGS